MWCLLVFDLPTTTKSHKQAASKFRREIKGCGWSMLQWSVYFRPTSHANGASRAIEEAKRLVPKEGDVRFLAITDRQWSAGIRYYNGDAAEKIEGELSHILL